MYFQRGKELSLHLPEERKPVLFLIYPRNSTSFPGKGRLAIILSAEGPEVAYGNKYLCRIRTQSLLNREKRCVL